MPAPSSVIGGVWIFLVMLFVCAAQRQLVCWLRGHFGHTLERRLLASWHGMTLPLCRAQHQLVC